MLISKLSKELQELVHKRQIEQGNDGTFEGELIRGNDNKNFIWGNTFEGGDFWDKVNDGFDMTSHPMYPKKEGES